MTETIMHTEPVAVKRPYPSEMLGWKDALLMCRPSQPSKVACYVCAKRPSVVENSDTEHGYCFECAVTQDIEVDNVYVNSIEGEEFWDAWPNVLDNYALVVRDLQRNVEKVEYAARLNAETIKEQQAKYSAEIRNLKRDAWPARLHVLLLIWIFDNFADIVVTFDGRSETLAALFENDELGALGFAIHDVMTDIAAGRGLPDRMCGEHREVDSCGWAFVLPNKLKDAIAEHRRGA